MVDAWDEVQKYEDVFREASAEPSGSDGEDVPDGVYQVQVESVEATASQKTNHPMVKWRLRVIGPTCGGRIVWKNNVLVGEDQVKWLKKDLATAGLLVSSLAEVKARVHELGGATLEIKVQRRGDYVNVYFNKRINVAGSSAGASASNASPDTDIPF